MKNNYIFLKKTRMGDFESLFDEYKNESQVLNAKIAKIEIPGEIKKQLKRSHFLNSIIKEQFKKGTSFLISNTRVCDSQRKFAMLIHRIQEIKTKPDAKNPGKKLYTITLGLGMKEDYYPALKHSSVRRTAHPIPTSVASAARFKAPERRPLLMYITFNEIEAASDNGNYDSLTTTNKQFMEYVDEERERYMEKFKKEFRHSPSPTENEPDPWAVASPASSSSSASPWTSADRAAYANFVPPPPGNWGQSINQNAANNASTSGWGGIPHNQNASTSGSGGAKPEGAKPATLAKKKKARLDTLTKQELIERCRVKKIPYSGRTKAELVVALRR